MKLLKSNYLTIFCFTVLFIINGCSSQLEKYRPTPETINELKISNIKPLSIGTFSADSSVNNEYIGVRGNRFYSPYSGSFARYIEESLRLELLLAKKLDRNSNLKLEGILLKNYMSTSGYGEIDVTFTVSKDNIIVYKKNLTSQKKWEAHFEGASAFREIQEIYKMLVSDLILQLVKDPDFIMSTK